MGYEQRLGRVPPHDEIAERALLGACLVDDTAVNIVSDVVRPDDFYVPAHRELFDVFATLNKDGTDVEPSNVASELRRRGVYDQVGGAAYLDHLIDSVSLRAPAEQFAHRIARYSQIRNTQLAGLRLDALLQEAASDEEVESGIQRVRLAWESGSAIDRPVALSELARRPGDPRPEWLVEGWWLLHGCGLLAGEHKSSKTTLALAIGMCVASGVPWLGRWPVRQGTVLAVLEEDHETAVRRRTAKLQRTLGIDVMPDTFLVLCQGGITIGGSRSRGRGRFAALVRKYRPVLTIADGLRRMTPGIDENDSRAVSDYLGWLRMLQRETGTAVMALHHFGKESAEERRRGRSGNRRRITDRLRGSSDFAAWADSMVLVERKNERDHKIITMHRGAGSLGAKKGDELMLDVNWNDDEDSLSIAVKPTQAPLGLAPSTPPGWRVGGSRPEEPPPEPDQQPLPDEPF